MTPQSGDIKHDIALGFAGVVLVRVCAWELGKKSSAQRKEVNPAPVYRT